MRRGRDLNPRIEGFAVLAIGPLWYRATNELYYNNLLMHHKEAAEAVGERVSACSVRSGKRPTGF